MSDQTDYLPECPNVSRVCRFVDPSICGMSDEYRCPTDELAALAPYLSAKNQSSTSFMGSLHRVICAKNDT